MAVTNVLYAYQRLAMADHLHTQAEEAYGLVRSRFNLGLASMTDVSQADLSRTDAAMGAGLARKECLIQRAILDHLAGSDLTGMVRAQTKTAP